MQNDSYTRPLIFIVDDDEDDLYFIKTALLNTIPNSLVKCFIHGKQLIDALDEWTDDLPSFILMDLNMPFLDGKETLQQLNSRGVVSKIPVIIFSTSNNPREKSQCLQYGATAYHSKPSLVNVYDDIMQGLKKEFIDRVAVI
ncbi:MAG: response regulator [Bacteroidetes bacterium]|nr:response regulator [Bacteroidota bacterium]